MLRIFSRGKFLSGVALAALVLGQFPASAQMAVVDGPVETTLTTIEGTLDAGFTTIAGAITAAAELIVQTISTTSAVQNQATANTMTAHAQELARWQTSLHDYTNPDVITVLPPNGCHSATAQLAWGTATAQAVTAQTTLATNSSNWGLGVAGSPSAGGPHIASVANAQNHVSRAAAANGGMDQQTAQALQAQGVIFGTGDGADAALHPEYLTNTMTLTQNEATNSSAWVQQMISIGFDPEPFPMPNPKTAPADAVSKALTQRQRVAWSELPIQEEVADEAPAAALQAWAQALLTQNGQSQSSINIPTNIGRKQIMDILINQRFGGPSFTTNMANLTTDGVLREMAGMASVSLQLQWMSYLKQTSTASMLGNQYAFFLNGAPMNGGSK